MNEEQHTETTAFDAAATDVREQLKRMPTGVRPVVAAVLGALGGTVGSQEQEGEGEEEAAGTQVGAFYCSVGIQILKLRSFHFHYQSKFMISCISCAVAYSFA